MNHDTALHPLAQDARFRRFVKRRSIFSWTLTAIIIAIYFGFIGIVAFRRDILAAPFAGGVTSLGIVVGIGVIVVSIVITGVYVWRANREFDPELQALRQEYGE